MVRTRSICIVEPGMVEAVAAQQMAWRLAVECVPISRNLQTGGTGGEEIASGARARPVELILGVKFNWCPTSGSR